MWMELALLYGIYAVGCILFGQFETRTSRAKRLLKFAVFTGIEALIYAAFGRPWSFLWLLIPLAFAIYVHMIWLPQHGVNGFTGEPKERYYALRGWKE